jgi:hypothetical protein
VLLGLITWDLVKVLLHPLALELWLLVHRPRVFYTSVRVLGKIFFTSCGLGTLFLGVICACPQGPLRISHDIDCGKNLHNKPSVISAWLYSSWIFVPVEAYIHCKVLQLSSWPLQSWILRHSDSVDMNQNQNNYTKAVLSCSFIVKVKVFIQLTHQIPCKPIFFQSFFYYYCGTGGTW